MSTVAVREKFETGLAHRITSSVAVSQSDGSARSAAMSSGRCARTSSPCEIAFLVVSLPATDKMRKNMSSWKSESRNELAVVTRRSRPIARRLHTSSAGCARFSAPSSVAYVKSAICAVSRSSTVSPTSGSAAAHHHVGEPEHVVAVGFGDADDVADELHRQAVRDVANEVDLAVAFDDGVEDLVRRAAAPDRRGGRSCAA